MNNPCQKYFCDWNEEISEFISSEKNMKEFCLDKEYTYCAFAYHYYKRKKIEREVIEELPAFLPVEIIDRKPSDHVVRVNGYDITVNEDTDGNALRTVLKAIGDLTWN